MSPYLANFKSNATSPIETVFSPDIHQNPLPPARQASPLQVSISPLSKTNNQPNLPRFAFCTLLTRDTYLKGAQCLQRSLTAVDTKYPLVVLYTSDTLSQHAVDILNKEGCYMLPVARYQPKNANISSYKLECYAECWIKLRMWQLDDMFHRIVYLDADMIVLRNLDHLFTDLEDHQAFYAVKDCAFGRKTAEERNSCSFFRDERSTKECGSLYI